MNILTSLFSRALLAMALVTGAGAAAAGPLYHVDLNVSRFSGAGFLDMQFNQAGEFAPATATLTGFGPGFGDYAEALSVSGSVGEGKIVFDSSVFNDLFQSVALGGHLGFDVSFSGPDSGNSGSVFALSLFDATGNALVESLLQITVHPGDMQVSASQFATVGPAAGAAVPEPSAALLVAIGLLMAVAARRRA
jgi:hypothetical protein